MTDNDIEVQNEGTIFLLHPTSDTGREWLEAYCMNGYQPRWPRYLIVEHRYVDDIVKAAQHDGLTVGQWLPLRGNIAAS